jgi:hypothetical protein
MMFIIVSLRRNSRHPWTPAAMHRLDVFVPLDALSPFAPHALTTARPLCPRHVLRPAPLVLALAGGAPQSLANGLNIAKKMKHNIK